MNSMTDSIFFTTISCQYQLIDLVLQSFFRLIVMLILTQKENEWDQYHVFIKLFISDLLQTLCAFV